MNELIEFLRARLVEREALARADEDSLHRVSCARVQEENLGIGGPCDCGEPARLQRDVRAKAIVLFELDDLLTRPRHVPIEHAEADVAWRVLCRLASEYSDHPDYDAEKWQADLLPR